MNTALLVAADGLAYGCLVAALFAGSCARHSTHLRSIGEIAGANTWRRTARLTFAAACLCMVAVIATLRNVT